MKKNNLVGPVVKWVGGKRQLLGNIIPLVPKRYTSYCEPFFGGGAVLFALQPSKGIINDLNSDLMMMYRIIHDDVDALIANLSTHQNTPEYFYAIRDLDRDKTKYNALSEVEKASRLIYLNKTCYNGLFRVNSAGEFNTPFGYYKNPNIVNEPVLRAVSSYFNRADITFLNKDFAEYDRLIARLAPERDVVTVSKNFQSNALLCGRLKKLSFKGTEFVVRMPDGKECVCRIPQPGGHHITNALLAIAVGFNEGISWEQIVEALASAPVPEMRSKISIRRGMLVIEDCYNANQDSMRAALETLAELPPWKKGGKRCAILGTMGEIGVEAVRIHRQIARYASELPIDYLLFCGEFAEEMCEEIRMETSFTGEVKACATIEDLKPYLKTYLEIGDMVLLKASRSQMFERIVPWLEELE